MQWPEIVLGARGAAADQEHGRALQLGVRHGGDAVGHTRTGGDQDDAELSGERGVRMGHVHGGALIAHVDNAYAPLCQLIPDGLDMTALETEHPVDVAGDEKRDYQLGD